MGQLTQVCSSEFEVRLFQAAFSVAFFGALRVGFLPVFRKCLAVMGLSSREYGTHSFRIGAATEAARLGLPVDLVKKLGRWESKRFISYIRPGRIERV
ncbi:uncharacterized protein PAF06_003790 [Gastrophryne carolinensis]